MKTRDIRDGTRIFLLSLGCAKNQVDSELLAGRLEAAGMELVSTPEEADVALINSCGFIQPAVEESLAAYFDLEELKMQGKIRQVGLLGCLYNRYGEELRRELPEVDIWARSEEWESVLAALGVAAGGNRSLLPGFSPWSRYLKIAEGCDNRCSYCMIPSIRGPFRSRPRNAVVDEARWLVGNGARELCLIAQDPTAWGRDLGGQRLDDLLDALEGELPADIWLRLQYLHPHGVSESLLERMVSGRQLLPYLDMPLQHADDGILASMNRNVTAERAGELLSYARALDQDFALRTTFITGFPGEDRRAFDRLLDFVGRYELDRVGAFTFWPEEGTAAAALPKRPSRSVAQGRLDRLMARQLEVSRRRQRRFVGRTLQVLVERVDEEAGLAWGRSFRDAPEVDGEVEIPSQGIEVGTFVSVTVTEALDHDLIGEVDVHHA